MIRFVQYSCFSAVLLLVSCHHPFRAPALTVFDYFQPLPPCDTLHVEISTENDTLPVSRIIPNNLFFSRVPAPLLAEIDYVADAEQARVIGRNYFPIDDNISAYWVEIRQAWFHHHSLLLYNKAQKAFTDRITLAEFYGGDGGQVLLGSWLFDFDGDGKKDIVRREIQHSLRPDGDDVMEHTDASATLLLWRKGKFVETPLADTAVIIKKYPIRNYWD